MPQFDHLRELARDRQKKKGAIGVFTYPLCLKPELVDELTALELQRPVPVPIPTKRTEKPRLTSLPASAAAPTEKPVDSELEKLIEDQETLIKEHTIDLKFHSLASTKYQSIMNDHPNIYEINEHGRKVVNEENWAAWVNHMADESFIGAIDPAGGKWENTWAEMIDETLGFGEWEDCMLQMSNFQRKTVTVSKSQKR